LIEEDVMISKLLILCALILIASPSFAVSEPRWFSEAQEEQGAVRFKQNCAVCHGQNAESTTNWKRTDENGKYPPPPLNGTGHAWHHDLKILRKTIRDGGAKLGGIMPAFGQQLSATEIDQVIAYFQSKWPNDTYRKWAERFKVASLRVIGEVIEQKIEMDNSAITELLRRRMGNIQLAQPEKTAIDNIWRVKLKNRYIYLSEDGRYAFTGDVIDLKSGENLTEISGREITVEQIENYSDDELVVYLPKGEIKTTLNVFTDTSCFYCRKLHKELPKLLESGIKVRYLPYARGGENGQGYETMKSVWCAKDRAAAMTDAKNERTSRLPEGNCAAAQIVDAGYITGNQLGVTGTPALFKQNGEKIVGYVPYQKLIPMLIK
jgi:thiol:disulfide interchange protein DsbC